MNRELANGLNNVAHEHFITQTGKKSKLALDAGPRAKIWGREPRTEKNKNPM